LAGAVNAAPVAFLSVAAAVLALGWAPRGALAIGAAPVVGGFVLYALADSLSWPDVVRDVSPFAHLAAVPAREPNVAAAMVMVALTLVVTAIGTAGYARRDLRASGS
jgi:ABC-2 type transport system permease protein